MPGLTLARSSETDRLVAKAGAPAVAVTRRGRHPVDDGGSVLRPSTNGQAVHLTAPSVDAAKKTAALEETLTTDPPEGPRTYGGDGDPGRRLAGPGTRAR